MRLTFTPPAGLTLAEVRFGGPVTLSPDGLRVVYVASDSGNPKLWVQPLDSTTAQALAGTDGAAYPFWSPDGRSIGFFANGKLKRIDAAGGPLQVLCDALLPRGGTWNGDGVIVFSSGAGEQLSQVSSGGGAPPTVLNLRESPNRESLWPSFMPDGRHFVYFGRREKTGVYVASLDPGVPAKLLVEELYAGAAYASDGYLMFVRGGSLGGTLFAQPIDLRRLELTGEPVPLAEGVPFYPNPGFPDFSVSRNGMLIHGTLAGDSTSLVWFDRAGNRIAAVPGASGYTRPILSPDEKLIGAHRRDPVSQSSDVWLVDSTRGGTHKLTTNPGLDNMGLWSPDGRRILYGSTRGGQGTNTYVKAVDGPEPETPLFTSGFRALHQTTDWSGEQIVFARQDPKTQWDLWSMAAAEMPADETKTPVPYLRTQFNEHEGMLSPDGRWMAYTSDQSGQPELYVGAFPHQRGRGTPVSTTGAIWPQWRRDGKELFYASPRDQTLMAVTVETSTGLTVSAPRTLFKLQIRAVMGRAERGYSPARDGQRFLVNVSTDTPPSPISVILNWPALVRR
jgi:Tol biopolymer transport system component